jgi:porin
MKIKIFALLLLVCPLVCGFNVRAFDIVNNPYLLGDWSGERSHLESDGFKFTFGYGSEIAHNYSGGKKLYTAYTDQWVFGAGFDFEKLNAWKGGTAQIMITNRNGENLGTVAGIGNNMLIQEVYGRGQTWHMTQFWYNQEFLDKMLEWKVGRATVGEDFASFSCDFQNLSFCGAQPGNIVGTYWLNWPTSVWATRFKVHVSESSDFKIGVYQVNPVYVSDSYAQKYGLGLDNPGGTTGALIPLEYEFTSHKNNRLGTYKVGVWYNTSPAFQQDSQYGAYISFIQQLTGTGQDPGLFVFLNVTQADRQTAAVDRQISLGAQYKGPFKRHDDAIGFGVACTDNNSHFEGASERDPKVIVGDGCEYDSELYYSYSPLKSVYLRPNLQYILHPGGTSQHDDAFVAGLKTGVAF